MYKNYYSSTADPHYYSNNNNDNYYSSTEAPNYYSNNNNDNYYSSTEAPNYYSNYYSSIQPPKTTKK